MKTLPHMMVSSWRQELHLCSLRASFNAWHMADMYSMVTESQTLPLIRWAWIFKENSLWLITIREKIQGLSLFLWLLCQLTVVGWCFPWVSRNPWLCFMSRCLWEDMTPPDGRPDLLAFSPSHACLGGWFWKSAQRSSREPGPSQAKVEQRANAEII